MQNTTQNLPEFLIENQNVEQASPLVEKTTVCQPLRKIFWLIICGWAVLLLSYLHFGFGWQNLAVLLPSEFAQFVAFAFLPLLVALLFVSLIFKSSVSATQSVLVQKSLNKLLFQDEKNALSGLLDQDLQKQILNLGATVRLLSDQTQSLREELSVKAEDFSKISAVLENNFMVNLQNLNDGIQSFTQQCQNATGMSEKVSENLATRTAELQNSARETAEILNPLINETIASAEHFQTILQNNKNYISKANEEMNAFSQKNQQNLTDAVTVLQSHQAQIEQAFLKTADNCNEIFKRLDSGISHIENSLKVHKELASEQASLIDKNATYLDGKLGEYGRLISLEVEEMIKRSGTLEMNVKKQLNELSQARDKTDRILNSINTGLEQSAGKAVKYIEKIVTGLDHEIAKLAEFVKNTELKNNAVENAAEKISKKIEDISTDLGLQVDNLKTRSVEAIDKFNEVSGLVQKNALQLSETANVISTKGKENSEMLQQQAVAVHAATEELSNIKQYFADISTALMQAGNHAADLFAGYKSNVIEFNNVINRQLSDLSESRRLTEDHLRDIKQQYAEMDVTNFIDRSAAIIQNLNNISVDINQFFNQNSDEGLWKKFYSGDYSAFARNIVKNMTRKQIIKIREEYEKNSDFRLMTDKYLTEFETLLDGARHSEKPQIILALLSGCELGKIYYIMARALDRLD